MTRTSPRVAPGRLLVVGDLATDVVAVHAGRLTPATDTPASITLLPGGAGANVAAWAADSGADVTLLARVGRESADWHRDELRRVGVTAELRVDGERQTTVVVCLVDAGADGHGERTMLNDRGASAALGAADWDDALLDGVAWLHLSGYLLFAEPGRELARLLLRRAGERGIGVSVDPASAGELGLLGPGRFLGLVGGGVDVLLPNLDEARLLSGATDPERAALLLAERTGSQVAVKLGPRGALVAAPEGLLGRVPAPALERPVVDTTGAGDAFAGALLAARLAGVDALQAAARGCAAGARAVQRQGARPCAPA